MGELSADIQYSDLLSRILTRGSVVRTRNSVVRRLRRQDCEFTLTPLVSLRKTPWRLAIREMEWFMSGSSNVNDLHPAVRAWWQPWASPDGEIPNNYSKQFRLACGSAVASSRLRAVDQIELLLSGIRKHPYSRRNILTTWNAAEMSDPVTPLTNCHHSLTQVFVEPDDNTLHMDTYQRSADVVVGLPANWIQTWALLLWLAHHGGRSVGSLGWRGGDCHLYQSHDALAQRIVDEGSKEIVRSQIPNLVYSPSGETFRADDFSLDGPYEAALVDRAEMVV